MNAERRVRISVPFLCGLLLFVLADRDGTAGQFLLAVAVHEGGHLLMMAAFHLRPSRLVFGGFGVRIERPVDLSLSDRREIAVYLAGPAVNLLAAAGLAAFPQIARIHLVLAGFNLLPLGVLDGGQILRCVLRRKLNFVRGERLSRVISAILSAGIVLLGLVFAGENPSMLFTGLYLVWNLLWGDD